MIYLDNNATTAVDPRVAAVLLEQLQLGPANPSSQHAAGRASRDRIDQALETIGEKLGSRFDHPGGPRLILTSGGTESNNLAESRPELAAEMLAKLQQQYNDLLNDSPTWEPAVDE